MGDITENLKGKLRKYLQERQKELLKEEGNVVINIGKYDMAHEVLEWLKKQEELKP